MVGSITTNHIAHEYGWVRLGCHVGLDHLALAVATSRR
jgi:hypothetical protein